MGEVKQTQVKFLFNFLIKSIEKTSKNEDLRRKAYCFQIRQ